MRIAPLHGRNHWTHRRNLNNLLKRNFHFLKHICSKLCIHLIFSLLVHMLWHHRHVPTKRKWWNISSLYTFVGMKSFIRAEHEIFEFLFSFELVFQLLNNLVPLALKKALIFFEFFEIFVQTLKHLDFIY